MSPPERQIRFFSNIHNEADFTIITDRENFFQDFPLFVPDEHYSYKYLKEGTMAQEEFRNYFGNQYRLTSNSYLIVYEFTWYSDDSANIREKRVKIIS